MQHALPCPTFAHRHASSPARSPTPPRPAPKREQRQSLSRAERFPFLPRHTTHPCFPCCTLVLLHAICILSRPSTPRAKGRGEIRVGVVGVMRVSWEGPRPKGTPYYAKLAPQGHGECNCRWPCSMPLPCPTFAHRHASAPARSPAPPRPEPRKGRCVASSRHNLRHGTVRAPPHSHAMCMALPAGLHLTSPVLEPTTMPAPLRPPPSQPPRYAGHSRSAPSSLTCA